MRVKGLVRDNMSIRPLTVPKKRMQREWVFAEMKLNDHSEKPSEKRGREKAEAVRRARNLARKRAQSEADLTFGAKR